MVKSVQHWIDGRVVEPRSGRAAPCSIRPIAVPVSYTRGKVVTSRWPDPADSTIDLGFPETRCQE